MSALTAIAVLAAAVRLIGITQNWLWYDELLSANFSYGSLLSVIAETLRFDVHPPLFYLQLHVWMFAGTSDQWLMLNPVLWSVAAVISCAWVANRLYGGLAGLLAGSFMALCAGQAYYAQQVRMYSMLSALIVWAWYWNRRAAESDSKALRGDWRWALFFECLVVYAHGAGLLMLGGVALDSLACCWRTHRRQGIRRWLSAHLVLLALALPALVLAASKTNAIGHLRVPTAGNIFATWTRLVAGTHSFETAAAAGAALIAVVCVLLAVRHPEPRNLILFGVLAPLAVFASLSHLARPLWNDRNLLAMTPFLCLALASGIESETRLGRAGRLASAASVSLVLASGCLIQQVNLTKGDSFKPAAAFARSIAAPGDVLYFRGHEWEYFCFMWYFSGPDWGEPRVIRTFAAPQQWSRRPVIGRLLPYFLIPDPGFLLAGGVKVIGEFQQPVPPPDARRVVRVVSAARWSKIRGQPLPRIDGRTLLRRETIGTVTVDIWE